MTGIVRYPDITRTRWSSADEADRFVVDNPATGRPTSVIQGSGTAGVMPARKRVGPPVNWRARVGGGNCPVWSFREEDCG
ncbi:hypothetical protein SAMN05216223_106367 [Actinacidiphila yanglinensis]|uniref:Uncharacterized protein n=1 Tax=Actinacidiphila yanglinensis TaxID=310779 RepID=A0A1H6BBB2_9ACTN|nr:hypothetical protein SAMN05216223_106367 [Actinacidiphila yanglinensis]